MDAIALLISGVVRVYKIGDTGREITRYSYRQCHSAAHFAVIGLFYTGNTGSGANISNSVVISAVARTVAATEQYFSSDN